MKIGPGVIVAISSPSMCQDRMWVLVCVPDATVPIQAPAGGLGK